MDDIRDVLCESFKSIIESSRLHTKRKKAIDPLTIEQFDSIEIWKKIKSHKRGYLEFDNQLYAVIKITNHSLFLCKINAFDKESFELLNNLAIDIIEPNAIDQAIQWLKDAEVVLSSFKWEDFANGRSEK